MENNPLPTTRSTLDILKRAKHDLEIQLEELRHAVGNGIGTDCPDDRFHDKAVAMDHINISIKVLGEGKVPSPRPKMGLDGFYCRLQTPPYRLALILQENQPEILEEGEYYHWDHATNTAFAILRRHVGTDYAMLWSYELGRQLTNIIDQQPWVLDRKDVDEWVQDHNWKQLAGNPA